MAESYDVTKQSKSGINFGRQNENTPTSNLGLFLVNLICLFICFYLFIFFHLCFDKAQTSQTKMRGTPTIYSLCFPSSINFSKHTHKFLLVFTCLLLIYYLHKSQILFWKNIVLLYIRKECKRVAPPPPKKKNSLLQ